MLNTTLLNTAPLNDFLAPRAFTAADYADIQFEGFILQSDNVISNIILDSSTPARELTKFSIPRKDGLGIIGDYFKERKIKITGYIKYDTGTDLENGIDNMKKLLMIREGNLYRKVNGQIRVVKATLTNPDQMFARREAYHVSFCPFDLEFTSVEPMWHSLDYYAVENLGITNLIYSNILTNDGTYKTDPVLTIDITAATAITAIQFTNNQNGDTIEVVRAFTAGELLVIDSENKSVTVNGAEVDYNGEFPQIECDSNSYTITSTGTSITYNQTLKAKYAYL